MQTQAGNTTLGTNAKSLHAAGKAEPAKGGAKSRDRVEAKAERFDLQRVAQRLLYKQGAAHQEQHRVCWCYRAPRGEVMGGWVAEDGSNSRLSGVSTCGSVWHCPVCAAKVCEERRAELAYAVAEWCKQGGTVYLVTRTFPHYADDKLAELLEKLASAEQKFRNARAYKSIMARDTENTREGFAGSVGFVRSLEVTIGANGWHPHVHELVFARRGGLGETAEDEAGNLTGGHIETLKGEWVKALGKVGLCDGSQVTDVYGYGLNVRGGEFAAEYVAKFGREATWGASSELTRQHAKVGSAGMVGEFAHVTPFQLLAWVNETGDAWASAKFREYGEAFSGKRMLVWSQGLRARFQLADLTDEDLADADRPELPTEVMVATITPEDLSLITSRAAMGEFLKVLRLCRVDTAAEILADYFEELRARPPVGRGLIIQRRTFSPGRDEVDYSREAA